MHDHAETLTEDLELTATELDEVVGGLAKVGAGTLTFAAAGAHAGATPLHESIIAI